MLIDTVGLVRRLPAPSGGGLQVDPGGGRKCRYDPKRLRRFERGSAGASGGHQGLLKELGGGDRPASRCQQMRLIAALPRRRGAHLGEDRRRDRPSASGDRGGCPFGCGGSSCCFLFGGGLVADIRREGALLKRGIHRRGHRRHRPARRPSPKPRGTLSHAGATNIQSRRSEERTVPCALRGNGPFAGWNRGLGGYSRASALTISPT